MPIIGWGSVDGGFTRTEARFQFLQAVDRVLPECRAELLELVPLVGRMDGLPSETVALLENKDFAFTVPRTPQDVQEVDVELVDGRVVRTTVVTRSAWRETWDGLLEGLDWWAKRWNAPPWMREVARATVVYAAAGWSRSWRLPPFSVHHEPVFTTVKLSVDLAIEPEKHARERLKAEIDQAIEELLKKAKESQKKAKVWKERDTHLDIRMEWAVYKVLLGLSWKEISERTCLDHPDLPFSERGGVATSTISEHVNEILRLLGN